MQELLGRIARLDPTASLGLRVIACFDELVVGNVNTRALLSAAASLAGCVCGFEQDRPRRTMRIDPRGEQVLTESAPDAPRITTSVDDGLLVWLEREGPALANDAIILERLALAIRIRHGRSRGDSDHSRDLGILLDGARDTEERCTAASSLGLSLHADYRVVAAPLFAVWNKHPGGPEDVIPSRFGPIHAVVVTATTDVVDASPAGVGVATPPAHLHRSFQTALTAVRLCQPPTVPFLSADDYGGLVALMADMHEDGHHPDADLLDVVLAHTWGAATLDALVRAGSVRQVARINHVHHKTMQARLEVITETLGWDPLDGHGRTRLGIAYLLWQLRHSRVLDLPAVAR